MTFIMDKLLALLVSLKLLFRGKKHYLPSLIIELKKIRKFNSADFFYLALLLTDQ